MKSLEELKKQFIDIAIIHEEAMKRGNHKLGNKQTVVGGKISKKLRNSEEGRKVLKNLMNHSSPSVRYWAATNCLPYFTEDAIKVLKEIEENENLDPAYRASVYITLDLWKNGELKLDNENTEESNKEDNSEGLDLDVLYAIESSEEMKNEEKYIKSLNRGMQMVFTTLEFEREIQNGGLNQFFWNAFPDQAKMARDGYKLIGAHALVEVLDEAVKMFMNELPENEKNIKENTAKALEKSYENTDLGELDEKFEDLIKKVNPGKLREDYIASHLEEFKILN